MITFDVKSYIVLAIFWDMAVMADVAPMELFFLDLGVTTAVTTKGDYSIYRERVIYKIIIDTGVFSGIEKVTNNEENVTLTVNVVHYDGTNLTKHLCPTVREISTCNKVGRYIEIAHENKEPPRITIVHKRFYIEHFVGCFKAEKISTTKDNVTKIDDCRNFCDEKEKVFYGLNAVGKCACAKFLNLFELVDLNLCKTVKKEFEMHGGDGVFSVFSKEFTRMSIGAAEVTSDCVFKNKTCSECPEGRKGWTCEIIDCSVNNGGCGDTKCQSFQPDDPKWEYFHAAFCECKYGYEPGRPICAEPFDECANGSDLCDRDSTTCVDKTPLYACECKIFFMALDQYKCQVDMNLLAMFGVTCASLLFCLIFVCCQRRRRKKRKAKT